MDVPDTKLGDIIYEALVLYRRFPEIGEAIEKNIENSKEEGEVWPFENTPIKCIDI